MNKDEGIFKDWGTGRKDTRAPTDFYQAGTEQGDFYQYEDDKDVSTTAKLRKVAEEVITKRHPQHKVRTKGTYEAGGTGRQDTRAPTDFYQAGTKQTDFYQDWTKQGVKDYEDGGAGRQDTRAPTDFCQAGAQADGLLPGRDQAGRQGQ